MHEPATITELEIIFPIPLEYTSYRVSKVGVIRLTQLQAQALSNTPGILVNTVSISVGYSK